MQIKERIDLCESACKIGSKEFMKVIEEFSKFALEKYGEEIPLDAFLSAILSMLATMISHTFDTLYETHKNKINKEQLYAVLINFLISKINVLKETMH